MNNSLHFSAYPLVRKITNLYNFIPMISSSVIKTALGLSMFLLTITIASAQYTGGIGSGYIMAEMSCTVSTPIITSNTPVCDGGILNLEANPESGIPYPPEAIYSWTGPDSWISDIANPTVNPVVAGMYNLTVSIPGCGSSIPAEHEVIVLDNPSLFIVSGGGEYCTGGDGVSILLSGSQSGVTYELVLNATPTGTTLAGTGAAIAFNNVTAEGTYTIIAENNTTNCVNTMDGNASVVINPLPTTFNVTGGGDYCAGTGGVSIFLSDSEVDVTYQLIRNTIATGITLAGTGTMLEFENVTAAGNYTITAVNDNASCDNVMIGSVDISILPLPNVIVIAETPTEFCEGGEVAFQAIPEFPAYQWFETTLGELTGEDGATYIATEAGEYFVVVTAENSCQNSSTPQTVTVLSLPQVSITPLGDTEICDGFSVDLEATATGEGSIYYKWYKDEVAITGAEGDGYSVFNATESGSYYVEITDDNCSNISNEIAVTIFDLPIVTITPEGPHEFCQNDLVEVLFEATPGFISYVWYKNEVIIEGAIGNSYLAVDAGDYYVTVTDINSCSISSLVENIIIHDLPVVEITHDGVNEICDGSSLLLEATPGYISYEWYFNDVLIDGHVADSYEATASGDYYVIATDINDCSNVSNTVNLIVNPLPEIEIIADGYDAEIGIINICDGEVVEILFEATTGFESYEWYKDDVIIDGEIEDSYLAIEAGEYYVMAYNEFGCFDISNSFTIIIIDLPFVEITTNGIIEFCSQELVATAGFESYMWFLDGVEIEGETSDVLTARVYGEYIVWAYDENMCLGVSEPIDITLPDRPLADAGTNQTIDYGTSTTLSAADGGTGTYEYSWEPAALLVDANVQNPVTVNLTETTVFTLMVVDLDTQCDDFAEVTVFVNPLPEVYTLTININPAAGGTVQVRVDGDLLSQPYEIEEGKDVVLTAVAATDYEFDKYVIGASESTNNPYTFTILQDIEITAVFKFVNFISELDNNNISLYPNPARNSINLLWDNADNNVEIRIYNTFGQLVETIKKENTEGKISLKIDVSQWQKGVYFIRLSGESGQLTKSFVVQ